MNVLEHHEQVVKKSAHCEKCSEEGLLSRLIFEWHSLAQKANTTCGQ